MQKWIFRICDAASTVLLCAFSFLYVRSYFVRDDLDLKLSETQVLFLESSKGAARVIYLRDLGYGGLTDFPPLKHSHVALVHETPPTELETDDFGSDGWDRHKCGFEIGACNYEFISAEGMLKGPTGFFN